jgi:hypothetical protein
MLANDLQHIVNVIARINDHRLARAFIANQRAITLQRSHRQYFVDHEDIVANPCRAQRAKGTLEASDAFCIAL